MLVFSPVKSKLRKLSKAYTSYRYRFLFYTLLLTFAAAPLLAAFHLPGHLLQIFLGINLTAALLSQLQLRSSQLLGIFVLLLLLARALASIFQLDVVALAILPVLGILAIGTVALTVRSSLRAAEITGETLYAALSGYLLAGLCMAFIYWSIERVLPGSFVIANSTAENPFTIAVAVYFSFVTLATLGYGDIVPATELARGLVILECVAGQLYLVVMVARLVSLYRERDETDPHELKHKQ